MNHPVENAPGHESVDAAAGQQALPRPDDAVYRLLVTPELLAIGGAYLANSGLLGDVERGGPDEVTCELYLSEVLNFLRTAP